VKKGQSRKRGKSLGGGVEKGERREKRWGTGGAWWGGGPCPKKKRKSRVHQGSGRGGRPPAPERRDEGQEGERENGLPGLAVVEGKKRGGKGLAADLW